MEYADKSTLKYAGRLEIEPDRKLSIITHIFIF